MQQHKVVNLELYLHGKVTPPATSARVAGPHGDTEHTQFGSMFVFDTLITRNRDENSKKLGNAKGTFMVATVGKDEAFLCFSAALDTEEFYGTIAFQGTDAALGPKQERELAIVGGTGDFRLASGFATYTTIALNIPDSLVLLTCTIYLPHSLSH